MKITTLCYIKCAKKVLMLHRTKKVNDENAGKWIGIGGKVEESETPEECLLREVREETGIELKKYRLRGIITFVSDEYGTEYMFLYTGEADDERVTECSEGELCWVDEEKLKGLPMWQGDKIFLNLIKEEAPLFSLKLEYEGEELKRFESKELL